MEGIPGELLTVVDMAASHNFVNASLASPPRSSRREIPLATESAIATSLGNTTLSFHIEGHRYQTTTFMAVPGLRRHLILGAPFLQQQGIIIDYMRGYLHVGTQRHTIHWTQLPAEPRRLETQEFQHGFPEKQAEVFVRLLEEFQKLFAAPRGATTRSIQHDIQLTDSTPINIRRPYRHSLEKRKWIQNQVQEMLANGVIEPSTSPYNFPIVIANKWDGTWRFCVDYRHLNNVTTTVPSVLPVITDTLRDLGNAFSTLDLHQGYWQVSMGASSKKYTAFNTPDGAAYQFKVMPFGLKNAPGTFQRLMTQEVLAGYVHSFVVVYLDDIIVYSRSWEEHIHHLRLVLERLQQHQLRFKLKKCSFGKKELNYLGHRILADGNTPQEEQLQQLRAFPTPENREQLRAFLGLCGWLRDYLPRFTGISAPLTDLLSTKRPFRWTPDADRAFQLLRENFARPLQLHRPASDLPYLVQTDVNSTGLAAVLYQERDGNRRIISYSSAKLRPAERKYHSNEQECLAVIWVIKKYRPYLERTRFKLQTNKQPLPGFKQ